MTIIKMKNAPKLKLSDLLKRRKSSLVQFLKEFGIASYEGLCGRCDRMGVQPPAETEFLALKIPMTSSPSEGVVVVDVEPKKTTKTYGAIGSQEHIKELEKIGHKIAIVETQIEQKSESVVVQQDNELEEKKKKKQKTSTDE